MTEFPRPKVVISKCLGFDACRFNGEIFQDRFVAKLGNHVEFISVCPEVEIGLGTPRPPVRLVSAPEGLRMIQPLTGADLTDFVRRFSAQFLDSLEDVEGFILTHRSPSCGVGDAKYYAGPEKGPAIGKTDGLFGEAVLQRFPYLAVEDDGRLLNQRIREHFLTRIFAFARLRTLQPAGSMHALVKFHSAYKFLILAHSEKHLRELGRIVANREKKSPREVWEAYASTFHKAFQRPARTTSQINVLMHIFGYVSDGLSPREKRHFFDVLEAYRGDRVPLQGVTSILWSWVLRFDAEYLHEQAFFRPFPETLLASEDSGKGRSLAHKSAS
jgi:uncharacterized protein YbgA (DUF1722 family)/uncharacterized protein YbbK (DUF523 family)